MAPDLSASTLFSVKGKTALITGGGSGLGAMAATALVQNGAHVWIASRKEPQLKELSEALTKAGPGKCSYFIADVSSKAGCEALAEKVKALGLKRLNILINNSGVTWGAPYDNVPEGPGWDKVMAMNVKSIFFLSQMLTPLLEAGATNMDPGRIINIASVAGISALAEDSGLGAEGTDHASKAAAIHLTKTQSTTLSRRNITANVICPGVFPSKMTGWAMKQHANALAASQPLGRVGTPEDFGGVILFLTSRASAHINGVTLPIDGGAVLAGAISRKEAVAESRASKL